MTWKLIVNPTAGSGYALQAAKKVEAELIQRGETCQVLYTEAPGHAMQLARSLAGDTDCRAVIAIGGDGTAFETASGLAGTGIPMGIIPAGTGNDFIKSIGTPKEPLEALQFILTHEPRPLDVGCINDRHFLNVCGVGFDVTVLEEMEKKPSNSRGLLPYFMGVLRAIRSFQPVHVRMNVDGQFMEEDALICAVANGRFIGGGIGICPEAKVDDGLLDVVLVKNVPRWRVPFYLPGLMMGKILKFGVTRHIRCRSVSLVSPEMRIQIDGEIFSMDKADFSLGANEVKLYW